MVDYTKTQHISSMNASSTTDGVKDGTDKMHSGLLKALELAAAGTAVLDYGSSVFRQVAGSTRTQFSVTGAIKYMREGLVSSATPNAVELTSDPDATNDRYDMIVIQVSDGHFAVRVGTAASTPRVADNLTAGDIPVALVKVAAGASSTRNAFDREVQLYGFDKATNSLSTGYNNSGYTETMSIYGDATRTVFKNKIADADIRFILADNTADEKFEILSDDDSDGDEGDTTVFSVDGLGATTISGALTVGGNIIKASDGGSTITMDTSDNVTVAGNIQVGGNIIKASDGGSTITMDTSDNVTIGGGLTTTTDLTVTGGDIVFGNGQNATASVNATAHNVAGKNLTITAGSPTAGTTNNIAGGHLTIQAGQGKGTGAGGDIIFKTANAAGGSASSLNAYVAALTISDDLSALFGGDITVTGNTITFGNGAIIENTSSSLLTITEATVTASGHITAGSSITAGTNLVATTSVSAGTTVSATTNLSTGRTLQLIPQSGDVAANHGAPSGGGGAGAGTILNGNQVFSLTAIDPTGGATFFTLPAAAVAAANGVMITVKNMSATVAATIEPTGGELIDGGSTALSIIGTANQITLAPMGTVTLAAFVENYWVIPSHPAMAAVGWIVTGHVA